MNNHESKKQFNSVQSLERFKSADFRWYTLHIINLGDKNYED